MKNIKTSVNPIYLDFHATTPMDPRVLKDMMPYLTNVYGNPSSIDHSYGYDAANIVQTSRETIASAIHDDQYGVFQHQYSLSHGLGGIRMKQYISFMGYFSNFSNLCYGSNLIVCKHYRNHYRIISYGIRYCSRINTAKFINW